MGEQLTDGERLSRLHDLLRRWLDGDPPAFETVAAAGGYLCERLAGWRVLLVVDDVCSPLDESLRSLPASEVSVQEWCP
jgi:hypothetical protein